MTAKKTALGSRMNRSETVTIRLDPKMRYLADIASRIQRRTLSSYVEWAINESFSGVRLPPQNHDTIGDMAERLWDVDEPDRFVYLASNHPSLLTHEEARLWKLIKENGALWRGDYDNGAYIWDPTNMRDLLMETLRKRWDAFVAVSRNEAPASTLENWQEKVLSPTPPKRRPMPSSSSSDNFDDFPGAVQDEDDDLPF